MVFRSAASMGLDPTGDDVDAIAVDRAGSIVFSLARGSISLTTAADSRRRDRSRPGRGDRGVSCSGSLGPTAPALIVGYDR